MSNNYIKKATNFITSLVRGLEKNEPQLNSLIKGLSFLEEAVDSNREVEQDELLNNILNFMIDKNYIYLRIYLHKSQYYKISAEKNSVRTVIVSNVSFFTVNKLIEALLRRIEEDVKTIKPNISKNLTHQTSAKIRLFSVQLLMGSNRGINGLCTYRNFRLRLLKENEEVIENKSQQ